MKTYEIHTNKGIVYVNAHDEAQALLLSGLPQDEVSSIIALWRSSATRGERFR